MHNSPQIHIRMNEGISFVAGGRLHALIITNGNFCESDNGLITLIPPANTPDDPDIVSGNTMWRERIIKI